MGKTIRKRPGNISDNKGIDQFINSASADQHLPDKPLREIKIVKAFRMKKEEVRELKILAAQLNRTESDLISEGVMYLLKKYYGK